VLAGVWLRTSETEISAEVQEAVAQTGRNDDALYNSTFTYFTYLLMNHALGMFARERLRQKTQMPM